MEFWCHKPRNAWSHQELEEAREDHPLGASEGEWPYQHLDFRLLASETVRKLKSVALNQKIVVPQSQQILYINMQNFISCQQCYVLNFVSSPYPQIHMFKP